MSNPAEQLQPLNIFSMSEDELSKLDPSQFEQQAQASQNPVIEEEVDPALTDPENPEGNPDNTEETEDEQDEEDNATEQEVPDGSGDTPSAKGKTPVAPEADKPAKTDPAAPSVPDYKEFYESLIGTPIKANGTDLVLKSKEDIIQLIQMGAGFQAKMTALKPVRRVVSMLEQNGIKGEEAIGHLIDLHNKKPEAIAKLVKDSGIDLYEFDLGQADSYKPTHQAPSDVQIDTGDTIQELTQNNPNFTGMLNSIVSEWDMESQNHLAANPHLLRILDGEQRKGNYDKVISAIKQAQTFGRVPAGVPMLSLYGQFEAELSQGGLLNAAPVAPTTQQAPLSQLKQTKQPAENKNRARAASPRSVPVTKSPTPANIFSLSDEEFDKIDATQFTK